MVTVIGLGFVGLTTALGFADARYQVCGIEKDAVKLQSIRTGRIPFYEPGLAEALEKHLGERFAVHDSYDCVADSRYVFVCVGTPCSENGEADLSYIFRALDDCLAVLNKNRSDYNPVFIIKSTVPPSTTFETIKNILKIKDLWSEKTAIWQTIPNFCGKAMRGQISQNRTAS